MQPEDVVRRLREAAFTQDLVADRDVDLHDARTVDALAERLVDDFYRHMSQDTFALLVDTTTPLLDDAVLAVRRDHGLAIPSTELVDAFFAELLLDVGAPRMPARGFVAEAMRRIEAFAAEVAGALAGGHVASSAGLLVADSLARANGYAGDEVERLGEAYAEALCTAFHGLDLDDRRLLVARVIDELPEVEVADELDLPVFEIESRTEQALRRFEQAKARLLGDRPEDDR